jgi:hypothetical protein
VVPIPGCVIRKFNLGDVERQRVYVQSEPGAIITGGRSTSLVRRLAPGDQAHACSRMVAC